MQRMNRPIDSICCRAQSVDPSIDSIDLGPQWTSPAIDRSIDLGHTIQDRSISLVANTMDEESIDHRSIGGSIDLSRPVEWKNNRPSFHRRIDRSISRGQHKWDEQSNHRPIGGWIGTEP
jgi:hypothetical protein